MSAAARRLRLRQPTLSAQLRQLEASLGVKLFNRDARKLVLTGEGHIALRHAHEIFHQGEELLDALAGCCSEHHHRLYVGVADSVPRLLAAQLLSGTVEKMPHLVPVCMTGKHEDLSALLATTALDVMLTDQRPGSSPHVRCTYHALGQFPLAVFAKPWLARKLKRHFPASLGQIPFLVAATGSALRHSVEGWFAEHDLSLRVVGEFGDSSLLKAFAGHGQGVFVMPTVEKHELCKLYGVREVGPLEGADIRYYAVTLEKRRHNPGIVALLESAKSLTQG